MLILGLATERRRQPTMPEVSFLANRTVVFYGAVIGPSHAMDRNWPKAKPVSLFPAPLAVRDSV